MILTLGLMLFDFIASKLIISLPIVGFKWEKIIGVFRRHIHRSKLLENYIHL